jgi:hypothetical protein
MEGLAHEELYDYNLNFSVNKCVYKCTSFCNSDYLDDATNEAQVNLDALEQSRRILERFNHKRDAAAHGDPKLSACYSCKKLIPFVSEAQCKHCCERFCIKHKMQVNHQCRHYQANDGEGDKIANAKNQFKLRLKEIKNKAAR